MLASDAQIIYVGKARDLKKRLSSYFRGKQSTKTASMVELIDKIEITITRSDLEALILESTLIKQHRPRYNVLFRDDKSYPFIYLSSNHDFARMAVYRGKHKPKGRYFGPYPSGLAVRETLNILQKVFKIRQCEDSFFKNRSRPCLQYQIDRCTAPCVDYIAKEDYQSSVDKVIAFLQGKDEQVIAEFRAQMESYSQQKDYENAAQSRDKVAALCQIQQSQVVETNAVDTDVFVLVSMVHSYCVGVMFVREGKVIGNKYYYPKIPAHLDVVSAMESFMTQYYLSPNRMHTIPKSIIVNMKLEQREAIASALSEYAGAKVSLSHAPIGKHAKWVKILSSNAEHALKTHLSHNATVSARFSALQEALGLNQGIKRMECFDISHTQGEATYASCVVFDETGARNSDYRRYAIKDVTPGDDYAAIEQALMRRYTKRKAQGAQMPEVLLIDGGKGQLHVASKVLAECQLQDIVLLSMAKGASRKAGAEQIFREDVEQAIDLKSDNPGFHLLAHIRDEAHRFAISGHRGKRESVRRVSTLESIEGVGPARRRSLLKQFGGMQGLKDASVEDIAKTPGVSVALAARIYEALHH